MSPATSTTDPIQDFLGWKVAVAKADAVRRQLVGRRVQMISHVRPDYRGPEGEIRRVSAGGFEVAWENPEGPGRTVSSAHPEDVIFI